ncbi:MAG: hypothetical protein AAF613_10260, partial [Pseudomonadota bacterium]
MTLIFKAVAVMVILILLAIIGLWTLGARQPSQAIYKSRNVIFLALRHKDPAHVQASNVLGASSLWRASATFPFLGTDTLYWTDYMILPPDANLLIGLQDSPDFEDLYAAKIQLTQVPVLVLGLLRAMHLLGITNRPDGPLPQSDQEIGGRADIMPTMGALEASLAMPADAQITMMNYLEYVPTEDGRKSQGRRTYNLYGAEAMKSVHMVGGQFLFAGRISDVLIA